MIIVSCTRTSKSPIEGAWRLAFEYEISGDSISTTYPGTNTGSEIKVWSGNTFIFVGKFIQDSISTDNFGGGTFKLDGNRYEESVQYHSAPEYLGQKVKLYLEVKNDTIIQKWPVDDNGEPVIDHYYLEKWVHIK